MMKKVIVSILALSMTVATFAQKWAPVGENIKSPWAEELNPAAPLPSDILYDHFRHQQAQA